MTLLFTKLKRQLFLLSFFLPFFLCCKKANLEKDSKISSIKFDNSNIGITIGETISLKIIHSPAALEAPEYEISINNDKLVYLDNLLVKAIDIGEAIITAKVRGSEVHASLNVVVNPISPQKISILSEKDTIFVGDTLQLQYTIEPSNTTDINNKKIEWTSSNPAVANVDALGRVKALAPGTIDITGQISGTGINAKITLGIIPVKVRDINLLAKSLKMEIGTNEILKFDIVPKNATIQTVQWFSSAPNIVKVVNGQIFGLNEGTATIKVVTDDGGFEDIIEVEVIPIQIKEILLDKTFLKIQEGVQERLTTLISPSNAYDKTLQWSSSNEEVVQVDNLGNITAIRKGIASITVKSQSNPVVTAECIIEVVEAADFVQTFRSTGGLVIINGFVTGNITSTIANNSNVPITFISFEIKDQNNIVVSHNFDTQIIYPNMSLNLISRLNSVDRPRIIFTFEINGKRYERIVII